MTAKAGMPVIFIVFFPYLRVFVSRYVNVCFANAFAIVLVVVENQFSAVIVFFFNIKLATLAFCAVMCVCGFVSFGEAVAFVCILSTAFTQAPVRVCITFKSMRIIVRNLLGGCTAFTISTMTYRIKCPGVIVFVLCFYACVSALATVPVII